MKRSEMLKIMWDYIQSVEWNYDVYMSEYDTEKLLRVMEQAGMSPPDYDGTTYGYNEGFITPPEWEPEE